MKTIETTTTTNGARVTFGGAAGYVDNLGREFHCKACAVAEDRNLLRETVRQYGFRNITAFRIALKQNHNAAK